MISFKITSQLIFSLSPIKHLIKSEHAYLESIYFFKTTFLVVDNNNGINFSKIGTFGTT